MTSVSQFAQYLLKLDPQRNPARLTLYNFLRHVMEPSLPFSAAVIQAFYARVLQFDHWQAESQSLAETVKSDVFGFLKQIQIPDQDAEIWGKLRHSDTLQLVPLKMYQDLADLVIAEHAPRRKSGDEVKSVKISDHQIMALVLAPSGMLEVKVYPAQALVWGSRLRLVAPVTHLTYSPELELMPHVRQILDGSLLTTHCFHVDVEGVHGLITRGYTFQKFETFIRAKMSETQDLFTSLKRLERHFINPQSDPFYQELVGKLERANRLLNNPTPDNLGAAERALNKGRLYLKNIFTNDRLLGLLVTHLDYGINQRRRQPHDPNQTPPQ
jgi:hypothetical protein